MSDQSCGGETHFHCQSAGFQFSFCWLVRTNINTQGTRGACWWSFPSLTAREERDHSLGASGYISSPLSNPIFCRLCDCLLCVPLSKVHESISSEIPRGHRGYLVTSLRESSSYTGPLVVHGELAVLQTQASFFEFHHSLLWCVHQSAGYSDTCKPREKREL